MTLDAEWDPPRSLLRITSGETFSFDDVSSLIDATDWRRAARYLWDLRKLREGPDTTSELRRAVSITEQGRELWEGSRSAILVDRDYDFGVARMFQAFAEEVGVSFGVFADETAALDWLEAEPEEAGS